MRKSRIVLLILAGTSALWGAAAPHITQDASDVAASRAVLKAILFFWLLGVTYAFAQHLSAGAGA